MGIRGRVTRTNLAYANENRDWRVFAEIAAVLMRRAQRLYADTPPALGLEADLFALDATVIDLSLALFPWARWQQCQGLRETQRAVGSARRHSGFCQLVRGKTTRSGVPRRHSFVSGQLLRVRSRVSRLPPTAPPAPCWGLLRHPPEIQHPLLRCRQSGRGRVHRSSLRPDHPAQLAERSHKLSGLAAPDQLRRSRDGLVAGLPHQPVRLWMR